MSEFEMGDRVTYDDENQDTPRFRGTITAPTQESLEYAVAQDYANQGIGPEHGDVLVEWDRWDDDDIGIGSWEDPSHLCLLKEENDV